MKKSVFSLTTFAIVFFLFVGCEPSSDNSVDATTENVDATPGNQPQNPTTGAPSGGPMDDQESEQNVDGEVEEINADDSNSDEASSGDDNSSASEDESEDEEDQGGNSNGGGQASNSEALAYFVISQASQKNKGLKKEIFFLGSLSAQHASGSPIPLEKSGKEFNDPAVNSFKKAPGLLVSRKGNEVIVLLSTSLKKDDQEHVTGYLQFENVKVKGVKSLEGHQRLEKGFDGIKQVASGQDEVWIENNKVHFHMTTSTADDGFVVEWEDQ